MPDNQSETSDGQSGSGEGREIEDDLDPSTGGENEDVGSSESEEDSTANGADSPESPKSAPREKTVLPTSRNRGHRDLAAVAFGSGDGSGTSMIRIGCPMCSQDIEVDPSEKGQEKECPHCGSTVKVPDFQPAPETKNDKETRAGDNPVVEGTSDAAAESSVHRLGPDRKPPMIPKDEEAVVQTDDPWVGGKISGGTGGGPLPALSSAGWKRVGIVSAVVLVCVVAAVNLLLIEGSPELPDENAAGDVEEKPEKSPDDLLAEELEEFYEAFQKSRTIEEKLEFVRNKKRAEERMNRFYSHYGLEFPLPSLHLRTLKRENIFGREFISFEAEQNRNKVQVFFEHEGGDRYKLDWESAVGYTDTNWKSFVVNQPADAHTFRVLVSRDDYYNYKFADPSTYLCVQLADVNRAARCYGYTKRDGSIARLLDEVLPDESRDSICCIAKVRIAEPGSDRQQAYLEELEVGWLEE